MLTFTFISDYRGGTYITQKTAIGLQDALESWKEELASGGYVSQLDVSVFLQKFEEDAAEFPPLPIDTISNVWIFHLSLGSHIMDVHIIQTDVSTSTTRESEAILMKRYENSLL